jgi:hypothetical protein
VLPSANPPRTTVVEVSSRRFVIPLDCPCCGAAADAELAIPIAQRARATAAPDSARAMHFPYCRHCIEHVARWEGAGVMSAGLVVIGVGVGAVATAAGSAVLGVTAAITAAAIGAAIAASRRAQARLAMRESCSSVAKAIEYLGWSGVTSGFAFESRAYAGKFAEQNTTKLIEEPRLRRLLEHYKLARLAVPTPAAAVAAIPPALDVGAWVGRISRAPGRAARRTWLQHALEAVREPGEREQLIHAVAALELAALLAPMERLPSSVSRKRHLGDAIAEVRADNLPEELQREVLKELEERWSQS